jgi:L-aspartate oxidase
MVIAKDTLHESSSEYAQGGIAVALNDDDEVGLHEQDTIYAGDGLCDRNAVHTLVEEGPAAIEQLIEWGAEFDKEGSRLSFTREGAHSRNRILHSHGDSTGREIARTLYHKASSLPQIEFRTYAAVVDLLKEGEAIAGALVFDEKRGELIQVHARAVLLATGGLGRVYQESTNPDVATGDGVAMAWRAGAEISNIEFVQFHPTALHVEGAPRFLLSEALRGEGARLINAKTGERFMSRYHKMGELAPRDVVSRAIVSELRRTGEPHVFLDITHRPPEFIRKRFPRIWETCKKYGVDISVEPAPVHPAAHYAMGGVRTDLDGQTNLPRLFAAGEASCTGVHGANRLASNSLLEAVVFGTRAGKAMRHCGAEPFLPGRDNPATLFPQAAESELRQLTWDQCGIVRNGPGLRSAVERLNACESVEKAQPTLADYESRNIYEVARLIARCALEREESRGGHYREDFPSPREEFRVPSVVRLDA